MLPPGSQAAEMSMHEIPRFIHATEYPQDQWAGVTPGGQPWCIPAAACLLKPCGKEKAAEVHLPPALTKYVTSRRKAVLPDSHVLPTFFKAEELRTR